MDDSAAEGCYEGGNAAFRAGDHDQADVLYSAGLHTGNGAAADLVHRLLSNRSQARLLLRRYEDCRDDCSAIIESGCAADALLVKALMRRAKCFECLEAYPKALLDCEQALSVAGRVERCGALAVEAQKLLLKLRGLQKQDEQAMEAGRATGIGTIMSDNQILRIFFLTGPPMNVVANDEPFPVRLCIGNEFGLWSRKDMQGGGGGGGGVFWRAELVVLHSDQPDLASSLSLEGLDRVEVDECGKCNLKLSIRQRTAERPAAALAVVSVHFFLSAALPSGKSVISAHTLPLLLSLQQGETSPRPPDEGLLQLVHVAHRALRASCIRRTKVSSTDIHVYVLECPDKLGIGGKVWDSSYVLIEYLARNRALVDSKRVLELGSGTGLCGLGVAAVASPSQVVLSDLAEVEQLLAANIVLNRWLLADDNVRAAMNLYGAITLEWGSDSERAASASGNCEVVLCSDVVYDPSLYDKLAHSLSGILCGNSKVCIMAHRHRHPMDELFFESLRKDKGLEVEEVLYDTSKNVYIFHIYCKETMSP